MNRPADRYREKSCPVCNARHRKRGLYCSRSCGNKKPHTEESKEKISQTKKEWHATSDVAAVVAHNWTSRGDNKMPDPVPPQVQPYRPDRSFVQDGDVWFED